MKNLTGVIAASLAAGAIAGAFGMASAAQFTPREGAAHGASAHGSSDSVSRADFLRLQGQVQELERRVTALERGGGHNGGKGSGHGRSGHSAGDSWNGGA